ncbi:MAG: hypothetical protein Q9199_002729 [Rusavskia elegans]
MASGGSNNMAPMWVEIKQTEPDKITLNSKTFSYTVPIRSGVVDDKICDRFQEHRIRIAKLYHLMNDLVHLLKSIADNKAWFWFSAWTFSAKVKGLQLKIRNCLAERESIEDIPGALPRLKRSAKLHGLTVAGCGGEIAASITQPKK